MRFVNADGLIGATGGILSHNMYAYTANNPVMRIDPSGYLFWDVLDVIGFASSMIDFIGDPTLANLCWLAMDTVGLLPLLPSMGTYIKGLKYFGKVDDVSDFAKGASKTIPDMIPNQGFDSFTKLKNHLGDPGSGNAWHHIVEQSQVGKRANFTSSQVNNVNNVISIPHGSGTVHSKISAHYSSKFDFTGGLTVRDWLATQSFDQQFQYGKELLEEFGDVMATDSGWVFKAFD